MMYASNFDHLITIDCLYGVLTPRRFNSISVISRWTVHLPMLSWSFFNQYFAQYSFQATGCFHSLPSEPHSPVGSVAYTRIGDRWFNPRLGQYSFRGLMMVIATGFIQNSIHTKSDSRFHALRF